MSLGEVGPCHAYCVGLARAPAPDAPTRPSVVSPLPPLPLPQPGHPHSHPTRPRPAAARNSHMRVALVHRAQLGPCACDRLEGCDHRFYSWMGQACVHSIGYGHCSQCACCACTRERAVRKLRASLRAMATITFRDRPLKPWELVFALYFRDFFSNRRYFTSSKRIRWPLGCATKTR